MVLDSIVSSPVRRTVSSKKQRDEMGGWSTLIQRHRFLLTAMVLLAFLCTIYLYFAITLGAAKSCSGLSGKQKAICQLEQSKASGSIGKLKFF